ncbi:DUF2726 domain-containing protein [Paucibacter sediminis]|uniref:DUF2726 domain-containing protein n=1 Tax=Paucibacter sediminis TaxID=3019553 RepID=A0AA95SNJ1_9BURK|nr:DUF2726 domain-containing protein [Paucibacter sp. S2-9]WIT09786.1 DUF2726 domain-containing protein [Paucibacter sp. S2-9]
MQPTVPWIIALVSGLGMLTMALLWVLRRPKASAKPLPTEWSLTARPVFSADERRVFRLLKEALPHHVVLSKLPLVRFCQPTEAKEVRYWYDLLGATHVSFAICSPNGRVLAAVDLDNERNGSGRSLQIKQSVLAACRVRYLRCPIDNLPSAAELQLLVPFSNNSSRGPQPAPATPSQSPHGGRSAGRSTGISSSTPRRSSRNGLWQDSAVFNDSFFAPDSRYDSLTGQDGLQRSRRELAALQEVRSQRSALPDTMAGDSQYPDEAPNDIVGVVIDSPRYGRR